MIPVMTPYIGHGLWGQGFEIFRQDVKRMGGKAWASKVGGGGGDGGDASPPVKNLGGDVPSRYENKTAQIRRHFRLSGYLGIGWPPADDSSPTQKSVATPLRGGIAKLVPFGL